MPYKLRVFYTTKDGDPVDVDSVVKWVIKESPVHFIVKHDADNDDSRAHIHAVMYTSRDIQVLRNEIKRVTPSTTRQYSLGSIKDTDDDVEAYERYMCHGNCQGDIVHVVSAQAPASAGDKYSTKWCAEQHRLFYHMRKQWCADKKEKEKPLLDRLIDVCKQEGITAMYDIALQCQELCPRGFQIYYMKSVVLATWYKLNKNVAAPSIADEICRGFENISREDTTNTKFLRTKKTHNLNGTEASKPSMGIDPEDQTCQAFFQHYPC